MTNLNRYIDATNYENLLPLYRAGKRIYFVGIGGISMCGLAELAAEQGLNVAGSDMQDFSRRTYLEERGIQIFIGQDGSHYQQFKPDLVVYTLAVDESNPEITQAKALGIPLVERAVFLGLLNRVHEHVINIAGTNGKSTTTTLCSLMLQEAGLDPTVHVGAEIKEFHSTVKASKNREYMVSEACEFGRSLLHFKTDTAVILNIAHDHVDCFPTLDDVIDVFAQFVLNLEPWATLILPAFDSHMSQLLERVFAVRPELRDLRILTFGYPENETALSSESNNEPDLVCTNLKFNGGYPEFDLSFQRVKLGTFKLKMPGHYNVENAMAAFLAAYLCGASVKHCQKVMQQFTGPGGRFTEAGSINGARLICDYAHHPDSVKVARTAAEQFEHERCISILEPIITSRAQLLCDEFVEALKDADLVLVKEIYDNRETERSFSAQTIADKINELGGKALFFPTYSALKAYLKENLQERDICVAMGTLTLHEALAEILD